VLLETMKNRWLNLYAVLLIGISCSAACAAPQVSGRVLDEMKKPLSGVQLRLLGDAMVLGCEAITKANGEFCLPHPKCKTYCLAVYPPKNSGLAAAWIDEIPGDAVRHIIIQLHPGFTITGRIIRAESNKGLKGLTLSISPVKDTDSEHETVHGSGLATTSRDGTFEITLTPGLKQLSVANDRYPELLEHFAKNILITDTGRLPDIVLPSKE
jgi:hypothetical protein